MDENNMVAKHGVEAGLLYLERENLTTANTEQILLTKDEVRQTQQRSTSWPCPPISIILLNLSL